MPAFQYQALSMQTRQTVSGVINANNEREARERLREQELIPTRLKSVEIYSAGQGGGALKQLLGPLLNLAPGGRFGLKERILFSQNLYTLVRAGIPLAEGLLYLETYNPNPKLRTIVGKLRRSILEGQSFSKSLSQHPQLFDPVYISVIESGEASGDLDTTLSRLTENMTKSAKLRAKVISASTYPAIVVCIMSLVLLVMFALVLPTFEDIFVKMGVEIPWYTQVLLNLSKLMRQFWYIVLPVLAGSIYGLSQYVRSSGGREFLDYWMLKVPVLGELLKFINAAQYISTLQISFGAGLPITEALNLARDTVMNTLMREKLSPVSVQIQAGQRLTTCLSRTGCMPDLVMLMLSTGEESGELDNMLLNALVYLEDEVNRKVETLTTMIEPALLVVLGVLVGGICLAIYVPLFSIYEKIG